MLWLISQTTKTIAASTPMLNRIQNQRENRAPASSATPTTRGAIHAARPMIGLGKPKSEPCHDSRLAVHCTTTLKSQVSAVPGGARVHFDWSVDPQDWRPRALSSQIAADATRAGPGDVILLHDWVEQPEAPDALDRAATLAALPEIVAGVRGKGLQLGPLR